MTDELLSAWVTSDSVGDTIERASTHQGNSPLYFVLLWIWRAVGSSEVVLRLPSVVCVGAAAWQLARLGTELDRGRRLTGLVAAFVLVAHTEVTLAATTARPYALLLLALVVSTRALVHFLHGGSWRAGLLWILAAATSLLMTPFAILALSAHIVAVIGAWRGSAIAPWGTRTARIEPQVWVRRIPALGALGVLVTVPLVPQVLALARRRDEVVTAAVPDVGDLVAELVPVPLLLAVGVGATIWGWRRDSSGPALRMAAAWAFGAIAACWAVSNLTGTSIWVDRYRLPAVPGLALLAGLGVGRIAHHRGRAMACTVLIVFSLASAAGMAGLNRHGWREAVQWARVETSGEPVTIALDSDLVELRELHLLDDPAWQEYLSGPVQYYGLPGDIVLLPTGPSDATALHQRRLIEELTAGTDTVVLISTVLFRGPPDHVFAFRSAMAAAGWSETSGPLVAQHQAVVFRRGA
jgi:hypothetical protein